MLVVPVGATVTFPNLDTVRHHIYSFSTAKKFEIKLYGREDARTALPNNPRAIRLSDGAAEPRGIKARSTAATT